MNVLRIENISKEFQFKSGESRKLFGGFNLEIPMGITCSILGPSGCGKSTLLRMIGGLETYSGRIDFPNSKTPPTFSFVFQEPRLLHWRTVRENMNLPFEIQKHSMTEAELQKWLNLVKLNSTEDRYPSQLSGGMKMRVALARALSFQSDVLLMDEPMAALDEFTREELQNEILELKNSQAITTLIFVTHSIEEAVLLSDWIVILDKNGNLNHVDKLKDGSKKSLFSREDQAFFEKCREVSFRMRALHVQ